MPLPIKSEHAEQVSFIHAAKKYLRANNKEYLIPVLFAIPNGGARDARTAGSLKMEGVRKGVRDVFFACARAGAHGLFIEMKKRKGGYLSKEQKEMMDILRRRVCL